MLTYAVISTFDWCLTLVRTFFNETDELRTTRKTTEFKIRFHGFYVVNSPLVSSLLERQKMNREFRINANRVNVHSEVLWNTGCTEIDAMHCNGTRSHKLFRILCCNSAHCRRHHSWIWKNRLKSETGKYF